MKVYIVVLLVLVAVAAASDVDKRLFLPTLGSLMSTLKVELASHSPLTLGVCEAACEARAGLAVVLCAPACELLVAEQVVVDRREWLALSAVTSVYMSFRQRLIQNPSLSDLISKLRAELASYSAISLSSCEAACDALAGDAVILCAPSCQLVVEELSG